MDIQKRNFINEIKKLKSIKADDGFKFSLRKKIFEEAGTSFVINAGDKRLHNQQTSNLQKIITNLLPRRKNMFIPLLLIIALLGGGAGTTYASQSSLPGDVLYPVKMATEKVQTVLTIDNAKEANLHLKFSEERLNEIDKLAQKGRANSKLVKEIVDNYKKELVEAKNILTNTSSVNPDQSTRIARDLADATNHNKETLVKISGEVEGNDALDILKDAWKEAVNHNDIARIELLKNLTKNNAAASVANNTDAINNTNTVNTTADVTVTTQNPELQKMVENKIYEASHKISEAEKYIIKKEAKGTDVSVAKTKIADAKTLIVDAQNLLNQAKYTEAFLKAKDAHQMAQSAKEVLENNYKSEHNKKEDSDDDENIFIMPTESLNGNSTPSAVNDGVDTSNPTVNDKNNQVMNSHEINERKNKVEEENKNSRGENKSESEREGRE